MLGQRRRGGRIADADIRNADPKIGGHDAIMSRALSQRQTEPRLVGPLRLRES